MVLFYAARGSLRTTQTWVPRAATAAAATAGVVAGFAVARSSCNNLEPSHDVWIEYTDASTGRLYFHNARTGTTVWDASPKATPALPSEDQWEAHVDQRTGKTYYHNAATGETKWDKPRQAQVSNAPWKILATELEKVWEGQRWWAGAGWCTETHRFVSDGEQNGGAWKSTGDAIVPSLDGLKGKAEALKAKVSGSETQVVGALTDGLLESANASLCLPNSDYAEIVESSAGLPCCWMWASEPWSVVRDGSTDPDGWTYAADWPDFTATREGGRKSQCTSDFVRRRCLCRPRVLVATGASDTPADLSPQLGDGSASLLDAIANLEQTREAERAAESEHSKRVMAVVRDLTKTHVLGRPFKDQPLDPTAWYRLANTHSFQWCHTMEKRPAVTDADALILRDLVRAMRFANGAYGFAAEQMVTIESNIKMHTSHALGGIDYKDGVEDSVNTASLCKLAEISTEAVVYSRWDAGPHTPACFLAAAPPRTGQSFYEGEPGWLVLGIRGTLNVNDALCDVDAAELDFLGGKAHQGFATAADAVRQHCKGTMGSTQ
jgi:hypothetical protein